MQSVVVFINVLKKRSFINEMFHYEKTIKNKILKMRLCHGLKTTKPYRNERKQAIDFMHFSYG